MYDTGDMYDTASKNYHYYSPACLETTRSTYYLENFIFYICATAKQKFHEMSVICHTKEGIF